MLKPKKTEKQGRPIQFFSFKKSITEIIDNIESMVQKKVDAEKQNIERLKTLTEKLYI